MTFDDVPQGDPGFNPRATAAKALIIWFKEAWDEMDNIERRVLINQFLRPVQQASLARVLPSLDNHAAPSHWTDQIQHALREAGAGSTVVNAYRWEGPSYGAIYDNFADPDSSRYEDVEVLRPPESEVFPPLRGRIEKPVPAESVEEQIERVENLLQEKDPGYDLRIYKVQIMCAMDKNLGGEVQETQSEMRGIPSVTTVRSLGPTVRETPQQTFVTMEIKFELLGTEGRVRYRDEVLIPGLMKIKGLRVLRLTPIHRTNVKGTIRTVRESFGGGPAGFAPQQAMLQKLETPRSSLEDALADWVQGSVMAYDVAVNTRDMRYTVMLPIKELLPYISREFRAPADAFDGMYQHFIANGAEAPVYVALGKNGRIKITGNEDIVWFAKRAGLEEVPVFISYQRQA